MSGAFRFIFAALVFGALAFAGGTVRVAAQDGEEGFPLPANTAYCDPGYLGPFVDCTPWEGVTVTYTSADGTFNEACTTVAGERTASCSLAVPFGSTITASIDPGVIPAGYVMEQPVSQSFEIPDGPPEGEFGGPVFVLLPAETASEEPTTEPPVETETPTVPAAAPEVPEATSAVVVLPSTGSGEAREPVRDAAALGALAVSALIAIAGLAILRRAVR